MKQRLSIAGLVMILISGFAAEPTSSVGKLHWRNGETLAGELLSADASTLTWKTPIVSEPAVLDRSRLLFLELTPPYKNGPVDAHWSLLLRNGDCVHGDAARLVHGKVEINCARHGPLTVPLDQVRSLRRLRGGGDLLYAGPCGQKDWQGPGFAMDGGALATRKWSEVLQLPMELPERMAADIVLRSTQLLNFKLGFQSVSGVTPTIETWGADVVLAAPAGAATYGLFVPLLKLKGSEAGLSLRIYWDQAANRMQVFDMAGKQLGKLDWTMAEKAKDAQTKPGIAIRNRGANWVIDELCVRKWDGQLPKAMPSDLPRVQLADGSWKKGGDLSGLDLESVQSVVWSAEAPPLKPEKPRPAAEYFDGTKLSGQLLSFDSKGFSMQVPWTAKPVRGDLAGLLRMIFDTPDKPVEEPALSTLDRLHSGTFNIHGTAVCDGGKEPRWRFIGGRDALPVVLPDKREDMEMVFARPPPSQVEAAPSALIIADDGSVLRAGFQALDETGLTFDSPWAKGRSMTHEHLRAVRMGAASIASKGFRDSDWKLIKGDAHKLDLSLGDKPEKDVLKLESGVVYGHPAMVRGDDIRFRFRPAQNYGGVQVDLYADDGESGSDSIKITLWRSSNQLYVIAGDASRGVRSDQMLHNLEGDSVDVKIAFKESKIQVFVNETRLLNEPVPPSKLNQTGLRFSCGSMWGNSQNGVEIREFRVVESAGALNGLQVSIEAKQEALTIPRFRQGQPPPHALVAANGDMVMGEVDAATNKLVRFTTGTETHDLPTDRVRAIVWLAKPKPKAKTEGKNDAPTPPAALSTITHWLMLDDQSRLPMQAEAFANGKAVGKSALFGQLEVPLMRIASLRWTPPAASSAVDSYTNWQLVEASEPVLLEATEQASKMLGRVAPDFSVKMLGEGEFQLSKKRGEVVVIDFWATWCGPCVASMPALIEVMKSFKGKPVTFITLNQSESPDQVKKFIERRKWDLPVAVDSNATVAEKYGVEGIPQTVIVGPDGKVEWTHTGFSAEGAAKLTEAINKALPK